LHRIGIGQSSPNSPPACCPAARLRRQRLRTEPVRHATVRSY